MKLKFLLFLFLLNGVAFGQGETPKMKEITDQYIEYYNHGQFEKIYEMYSDDMKNFMPLKETKEYHHNLLADLGAIESRSFDKINKKGFIVYKALYQNGEYWNLWLGVDRNGNIAGLTCRPLPKEKLLSKNTYDLPMKGEWFVFWGGDTEEQNYHVVNAAQSGAFDFVVVDPKGKSYKNKGKENKDYYAFGKELFAPIDAEVVLVVDGIKDNIPGEMNTDNVSGNAVVLKAANDEYVCLSHFKQHSIVVEQGQMIKKGQLLGQCGNSGNSSEAHLHFHIQNQESRIGAKGIKCFFDKIMVDDVLKENFSPVRGSIIRDK